MQAVVSLILSTHLDLTADNLSAEEALLWHITHTWRDEIAPNHPPPDVDWTAFIELVVKNKLAVLVSDYLHAAGWHAQLAPALAEQLDLAVAANHAKAQTLSDVLRGYFELANANDVQTIPLKGLWVSERIYGNQAMRPGHDLDLLTKSADTRVCITLCEQLGFDRFWPGLLPDAYYMRHHLHLELSLPDCWTWIEVHWAFDHPRTLLTIDYDAILARTTRADLLGATIWEPNWVDVLLSLSVHLVKHAIYLPAVLDHPKLARILIADKRLMHALDIAELLKQHGDVVDWALMAQVAAESGATRILHAVLTMCQRLFDAPVPDGVLASLTDALSAEPLPRWQRRLFEATAEHILAKAENRPQQRGWSWLLEPNWKLVFRPIRLLDYILYLFPSSNYLTRAYGKRGPLTRIRHSARAALTYLRLVWDTLWMNVRVQIKPLAPDIELPPDSKCRDC